MWKEPFYRLHWFNVIFEDSLFITVRYIICQIASAICMLLFVREEGDYLQYALASVLSSIIANISNVLYIKKSTTIFPNLYLMQTIKNI